MKPTTNYSTLAIAVALMLVTLGTTATGQSHEGWPDLRGWPEYGGTLARAGLSPATGPAAVPPATATAALDAPSFSAPISDANGVLFVGDDAGTVWSFEPNLDVRWKYQLGAGPIRSSLALCADGGVYVSPVDDQLYAIDAATGALRWNATVGNFQPSRYVVTAAPGCHPSGLIVQPSMNGHVYAFYSNGTMAWDFAVDAVRDTKVVTAPAVTADGTIVIGSQNGVLYAITPDGQPKWSVRLNRIPGETPTADPNVDVYEQIVAAASIGPDGTIYAGTRQKNALAGMLYAITDKGDSGSIKWATQLNEKITAPAAVSGNGVYVGETGGSFYRLNAGTGAIVWEFNPTSDDPGVIDQLSTSPSDSSTLSVAELAVVDAAGRVYVSYWNVDLSGGFPPQGSLRSPFYALGAEDGQIQWRQIFPKTMRSPLLAPWGALYLAGDDAKIHHVGPLAPLQEPDPAPEPEPAPAPAPPTNDTTPTPTPTEESPAAPVMLTILAAMAAAVRRRDRRH